MRLISQVYHRDILWKRGDLVSVVEDNEEYVAQIRAVVLARLAMPGVIVRWLLPGPDKKWEVSLRFIFLCKIKVILDWTRSRFTH